MEIRAFSWTVRDGAALKWVDQSVFLHNSTGVPADVKCFFDTDLEIGTKKQIQFYFGDRTYSATFRLDTYGRARIEWGSEFSTLLRENMPYDIELLLNTEQIPDRSDLSRIKFTRRDYDSYCVDFVPPKSVIYRDIEDQDANLRTEGVPVSHYGTIYETDPQIRRLAIEYHGLRCAVCNFHFGEQYGENGAGYIEVHDIKPLSESGGESGVNFKTDLTVVCANCHRIIHRRRGSILSIEEMKEILKNH